MPSALHPIDHHLAVLWMECCRGLETTQSRHEGMILTEQATTLERFLDHPHLTEAAP